jgi:predicted neuraminidase
MLISDAANHSRWGAPVNVSRADNLVQPTVVRTAPGTLTAFFRDRRAQHVYGAASADEGLTWTAPSAAAAGGLPNNNAGIEAFQLASGATILLFNNATKDRTPLTAALSRSAGAAWTASRNLQVHDDNSTNTQGVEYSYPTVLQTPDGAIHAAYTYNRQTIKYVRFTEAWVLGDGKTWWR